MNYFYFFPPRADQNTGAIHIYDARTKDELLKTLDKLHASPVVEIVVSDYSIERCVCELNAS